ncbi:MAG TPA: pilus assembly protein TadG-related protein [Candidatus Limnocylindria bacterium]|nr:pilus assembly protein TadG-related protein [Candidatus Limnocylindria bacterium]
MPRSAAAPRGQVLVIVALGIIVLLALAGIAVDVGRLMAERRHMQTAADAAALAACQSLKDGAVADEAAASMRARSVASVNLQGSPSGTAGTIADPAVYRDEDGSGFLDADELVSGVVVSSTAVRVAISGDVETTLARVVGVPTLGVGARAHCALVQEPALPIVARRYDAPPGPGGNFKDVLATEATSTSGQVDSDPLGYNGRTPASLDVKGPSFEIYGVGSKAHNSSSFRGFINLDIRDFRDVTSRDYYNGATAGVNENTMKAEQAEYVLTGYPGPGFPAAVTPPTGALQVATLSGHSTGHLVDAFDDMYDVGDRIFLAVYDGTVRAIPDFSITPPSRITLPSTTSSPTDGPTFTVSRNDQFTGTVELQLLGDEDAPDPADNILPVPGTAAPAAGEMNEPVFNPDNFLFASNQSSRTVVMEDFSTNAVAPGIYTVWVMGESNVPYKGRRHPVPVYVGGATRSFNLSNSSLSASAAGYGDAVTYTIRVRSESWATGGSATPVALSWDPESLSDCILNPITPPAGMTVGFSAPSVTPGGGQGTASTMTVDTDGLAAGCYMFTVRAHATNSVGQPVTRLATATLNVVSQPSDGEYVEIIGFAAFEVESVGSNTITGRAISPICADPDCAALRAVQRPRLIPWSS